METKEKTSTCQRWCHWVSRIHILLVSLIINVLIFSTKFDTTERWTNYKNFSHYNPEENKVNYSSVATCDLDEEEDHHVHPNKTILKPTNQSDTTLPYLHWSPNGRLGNTMFEFASSFCVAVQSNHIPIVYENTYLLTIFDIPVAARVSESTRKLCNNCHRINERKCCIHQPAILKRTQKIPGPVQLSGFLASYKYFLPCEKLIKNEFTLNLKVRTESEEYLRRSLDTYYEHNTSSTQSNLTEHKTGVTNATLQRPQLARNCTFVGVHVRRTDRIDTYPPVTFFKNAFQYYEDRYQNVVFYVCSDDVKWCKAELQGLSSGTRSIVFVSDVTHSFALDFAILMNCNHSIITAGTFSFWAGWLAGGEVIYHGGYDKWQTTNHSDRYKSHDFYPPNWIKMD